MASASYIYYFSESIKGRQSIFRLNHLIQTTSLLWNITFLGFDCNGSISTISNLHQPKLSLLVVEHQLVPPISNQG